MPVSKRDKKVSLTKTLKKGMAMKQHLVENIKIFLDKYDGIFVFTVNNMRNGPLKDLREEWNDSRFFFAKRKVMAMALGRTEAEEVHKNIHKLARHLVGQCGLLFTNRPKDHVLQWFRDYSQMEFAKSGFVATETVKLPAGPMPDFSFSLEPHLRTLGLPTQLEKGKIILREDYTVCTEGSKLTPEQASILKLIGKQMAEFKVQIVCMWSKDGSFERFKVPKAAEQSTPQYNSKLKNKNKKNKSNLSGLGNKMELEITQPLDQPTISDSETLKENIQSAEMEKSKITPANQLSKIEDEIMNEECEGISKKNSQANTKSMDGNEEFENLSFTDKVEDFPSTELNKKISQGRIKKKTEEKVQKEGSEELPLHEATDHVDNLNDGSPKITRENPRRSMRTPKPIRRSPGEKTQSVKKLTESNKKAKSVLKDKVIKTSRNTPRKSVSKRIFEETEDVEMAE